MAVNPASILQAGRTALVTAVIAGTLVVLGAGIAVELRTMVANDVVSTIWRRSLLGTPEQLLCDSMPDLGRRSRGRPSFPNPGRRRVSVHLIVVLKDHERVVALAHG